MVHLRIVTTGRLAEEALELLQGCDAVINVVVLPGAARKPEGDVILCDVAKEEASVVIGDLQHMGIADGGSIAVELVDSEVSSLAGVAERAASGLPTDAVLWEEVEARTSESTELSVSFLLFTVIAMFLAAVAILLDSPVLLVGAMVVGPEFGPLAGLAVGLVERRRDLAARSLKALAVGFPLGIAATWVFTELLVLLGLVTPAQYLAGHQFTAFISEPNAFSAIVAALAGTAGTLSLTTAKSGALVGVLISVTTIPSAANVAVAAAFRHWPDALGAAGQLAINLGAILVAGFVTLYLQRRAYVARRDRHIRGRRER